MPSKMYSKDNDIQDKSDLNNDNQASDSASRTSTKNVSGDSETKGLNKKSIKSSSSHFSPFIFPEDIDEDDYEDVLINDGHLRDGVVEVVSSKSKVSTGFAGSKISREELAAKRDGIGKKSPSRYGTGVSDLKHKLGFSVKNLGRKLLVVVSVGAIFAIVFLSISSTWIVRLWNNTPQLEARPFESSVVFARDGKTELFKYYKEERREIVDLCTQEQEQNLPEATNCIPEKVQLAAIALEDENFYYNEDGIPWSNIAGAAFECLKSAGGSCRGGSGLSQQLVKNVTKQDDFSVERKVTELLTAIKLNKDVTKNDILFLYLNQVSFGRNAYGVQEAAKSYFGKNVRDLNAAESCYIAALTQKPTTFSSSIGQPDSQDWSEFEARKNSCLEKLNELQLKGSGTAPILSDEDYKLNKEFVATFTSTKNEFPFPHFRDYVTQELLKFRLSEQALATQGYKIVTTLDPDIQRKTEESIKSLEQTSVIDNGANNVAAVVLDGPSGEIVAMVGSRDYNDTSIDGQVNVVTSPQQPGSSIKPYVYAAALNKGFNPGTVLMDVPTTFDGGFTPKNYSGTFSGPISIRNALQNSLNIPAVKAAYLAAGEGDLPNGQAGIQEVFKMSESMGVRYPCVEGAFNNNPIFPDGRENCQIGGTITPEVVRDAYKSRCYVSAAIGGCELTMLSHATGMNTFAQDGNLRTATPFISIVNTQTGRDIYRENMEGAAPVYPRKDGAIDPLIARQMSTILSDYQARYRTFGTVLARNLELDNWTGVNAVAAKTGTTDLVRDTWTVGYTPYYTTAVWVGNTDNTPMKDNASSASAPAPIWKAIMTSIHTGKEPRGESREGLVQARLNPQSGSLVENGGYIEWLTPAQVETLKKAQAILSKPEFDPTKSSIFTNRSTVITRRIAINRFDGLIADEKLTLPGNTIESVCADTLSEFPLDPAWNAGVRTSRGCPTDKTGQNQFEEKDNLPKISVNVANNKINKTINVNASVTGNNLKIIRSIKIYIDGNEVGGNENSSTLSFTIPASLSGVHSVRVLVSDSWGINSEYNANNVELIPEAQ